MRKLEAGTELRREKHYLDNSELENSDNQKLVEIRNAETADQIRAILLRDAKEKAFIYDEKVAYNPGKPWIVYEPMNVDPKPYVALGLMRLAMMELNIEKSDEVCLIFSPSSATWMEVYTDFLKSEGYEKLTIIRATKDEQEAARMDKPQVNSVSSYTGGDFGNGRMHGNENESFRSVYFENPERINNKRVVVFDDVLAQAGTLEDIVDGLWGAYSPKRVDSVNVLSKGRIQQFHRDKDIQRGIGYPRKGVERAIDCLNRVDENGVQREGELIVVLDVTEIEVTEDGYEIYFDREELANAA